MEKIIKLGIQHVAELVFDSFDTSDLINYMEVSETWKVLAEDVLIKRCKRWKFLRHAKLPQCLKSQKRVALSKFERR